MVKPRYSVPAADSLLRLLAAQALSRAAGAPLVQGNEIRILKDASEHFGAWLTAIHAASAPYILRTTSSPTMRWAVSSWLHWQKWHEMACGSG